MKTARIVHLARRYRDFGREENKEMKVKAPKKTKTERRLERNEKREKAKAEKKKKAPKAEKKPRVKKEQETPLPLPELTREVEVKEVVDSAFVQVKFKGAWTTGYMLERDQKAAARFGAVHIADTKFSDLKKVAKKNEQDAIVCIIRKINGKQEQGYALPISVFYYLGDNNPYWRLEFDNEARLSHAQVGWDNCKFVVTKAQVVEAAA